MSAAPQSEPTPRRHWPGLARLGRAAPGVIKGLLALALLALATERFFAAGLTNDEASHLQGLEDILRFAGQALSGQHPDFEQVYGILEFYGIGTLLPAYGLSSLLAGATGWPELVRWGAALHLLAFASYLLCLWSTWRILRRHGHAAALYGTLGLALLPEFLGHGLFNYKDMPVALGVILALQATLAYAAEGRRRALAGFALAVAWLGLQKLAAVALAAPFGLALLVLVARRRRGGDWAALAGSALLGLLVLYAATPAAWLEPLRFAAASVQMMAHHIWAWCMVTDGRCIGPTDSDWSPLSYLWLWTEAKVPLAYLAAVAAALLLWLRRPTLAGGLALAAIGLFLLATAISRSTLYDSLRHVLFLMPLAACLVGASGLFGYRWVRRASLLVLLWLALENLRFYPYNYAWFTPLTSLTAQRHGYDADYWGYSLRAALAAVPPGATVGGEPSRMVTPFVVPGPTDPALGTYRLWISRGQRHFSPGCVQVDAIARHTLLGHKITMSHILRCP